MARRACDEDGWVDYRGACDELESMILDDYGSELDAIIEAVRADETGAAWQPAVVAIHKLAASIVALSDTPFLESELEMILETMVEGSL